jgi:hypothetical protein
MRRYRMRRMMFIVMMLASVCVWSQSAHADNRLGVGAHYWTAVDNIDIDAVDEDGLSYLLTYQHAWTLLILELDVEVFPEEFTGTDSVLYAPQAFLLVGNTIYAGLGVGVVGTEDDFASEPFYTLKAGLELTLFQHVHLDINANYNLVNIGKLDDVDASINGNTITIGAAVRLEI